MGKVPLMVAVLVLAASATAAADAEKLSGDELKELMAGAQAYGIDANGASYFAEFLADGTALFEFGVDYRDSGVWSADGDEFCTTWEKIREGKKACYNVVPLEGLEYRFISVDGEGRTQVINIYKP